MLDILIYTTGKNNPHETKTLENEYLKRMHWKVSRVPIDIKTKAGSAQQQKLSEGNALLQKVDSDSYLIALDEKGALMNSLEFAEYISKIIELNKKSISFCIGGAFGHSNTVIDRADSILSLSKMTFPHKLVPLILCEQLYRAYTIINKHPYHKS